MVGVPVVAADSDERAEFLATSIYQSFLNLIRGRFGPTPPPVESMEGKWRPDEEAAVQSMIRVMVVGGPRKIREGLDRLISETQADELIVTTDLYDQQDRLRSYQILSEAAKLSG
jgi:alkanesulfonate monooxygenase SsuD/methylene tetrahydromethanopterin reductase-like flavin-dependent oxidoreductase (luciferase family)